MAGPHEPLGNRRFCREERLRDFGRSKTAKCFERERDLVFVRYQRVTACENQPQPIVLEFGFELSGIVSAGFGRPLLERRDDRRLFIVEELFAPDQIQREVLRGLREPRRGIFRNAVIRPRLERPDERFLHDVFRQLQALDAEDARQHRHEFARFGAEEVVRQP